MARCVIEIKVKMDRFQSFLDRASAIVDEMPEGTRTDVWAHWDAMQANGCELSQMLFKDGILHCAPSDDLRRAFAKFGIFP